MTNIMAMKRGVPWTELLLLGSSLMGPGAWGSSLQPVEPLPTPFPEARYQRMSAKSPFAVASAATAATAATPGFAAQLYVDGVAHIGTKDFVAIKSRDPGAKAVMFLEVGKSTEDGMKVERVQWSDEMGRSTVDVTKAGEKATLIFDEQQIAKGLPEQKAQEDDRDMATHGPIVISHDSSGRLVARRMRPFGE